MANEITATASLSASKGGASINNSGSKVADMAGDQMIGNVQAVGTAAEALNVGDVSTIGYVYLKNMDATNFVEVALDSAVSTQIFAKLLPGDVTLVKAKTATMYVKADTAGVNLFVGAAEL
jgi:hypothetical protein